jgi:hypothetical protein
MFHPRPAGSVGQFTQDKQTVWRQENVTVGDGALGEKGGGREGERKEGRERQENQLSDTCKKVFLPVKLCFVFDDFRSWE